MDSKCAFSSFRSWQAVVNLGLIVGKQALFSHRRKPSLLLLAIISIVVIAFYSAELFRSEKPHIIVSNSWAPSKPSGNMVIGKKVATIIESRKFDNLIPLILHFSSVLGPSWPIVLFTSLPQADLGDSAAFMEGLSDGRFEIRSLPSNVTFTNHKDVSSFLTKPWFWEQLAPADHVLIFQADSIICANAQQHVDDYLEYDMIGAPIRFGMGQGYNGGLSLRSRQKMLDIVRKHNWEEAWEGVMRWKAEQAERERLVNEQAAKEQQEKDEKEKEQSKDQEQPQNTRDEQNAKENEKLQSKRQDPGPPSHTYVFPENPTPPWEDYEDQWFFKQLASLPKKWNGQRGANLPPMEVAMTFSVETVWYDTPLGYHQADLMFEDRLGEVGTWCPEYRLCTDKRFQSAE
jgi:hypothetical protein